MRPLAAFDQSRAYVDRRVFFDDLLFHNTTCSDDNHSASLGTIQPLGSLMVEHV
jgi:hypothetical protein